MQGHFRDLSPSPLSPLCSHTDSSYHRGALAEPHKRRCLSTSHESNLVQAWGGLSGLLYFSRTDERSHVGRVTRLCVSILLGRKLDCIVRSAIWFGCSLLHTDVSGFSTTGGLPVVRLERLRAQDFTPEWIFCLYIQTSLFSCGEAWAWCVAVKIGTQKTAGSSLFSPSCLCRFSPRLRRSAVRLFVPLSSFLEKIVDVHARSLTCLSSGSSHLGVRATWDLHPVVSTSEEVSASCPGSLLEYD